MRIRKNAKQSPLSEPVPESLRGQVCHLNQSPWDVTPFSPPTSPSYHDHPPYPSLLQANYQFDGEDSITGNGSFGDSIGAVESSVASIIDEAEGRAAARIHDNDKCYCATRSDDYHVLDEDEEEEDSKMEDPFKDGPSQPVLESCGIHNSSSSTKKAQKQPPSSVVSSRRGRPRTVVKTKGSSTSAAAAAANPYDFYYYSGFGPSWRKRRGDRAGDDHQVRQNKDHSDQEFKECENDINSIITTQNNTVPFGGSHHRNSNRNDEHELSYLLDDDEEEEGSGRKRMRKPVKARSLKSLM